MQSVVDKREVEGEATPEGIPILKVFMEVWGNNDGVNNYLCRACTSYFYIGASPVNAHFIDVFAPYRYTQLKYGNFHRESGDAAKYSYAYNAHKIGRAETVESWSMASGINKALRAMTSHFCYWPIPYNPLIKEPLHIFTNGYVGYPRNEVTE